MADNVLRCYSGADEKVLLAFYPCKNSGPNMAWEEWHGSDSLVVYASDYKALLLEYLNEIFPLDDPTNGQPQPYFDVCSNNWIDREPWLLILDRINGDMYKYKEHEKRFYRVFLDWISQQLCWADMIVVEGNQ